MGGESESTAVLNTDTKRPYSTFPEKGELLSQAEEDLFLQLQKRKLGVQASLHQDDDDEEKIPSTVSELVLSRLPWLMGLMLLQSLTAVVMERYQGLVDDHMIIAAFITMLVGGGGNISSQVVANIVATIAQEKSKKRDIEGDASAKSISPWGIIIKELAAACVLGLALCVIVLPRVMWQDDTTNYDSLAITLSYGDPSPHQKLYFTSAACCFCCCCLLLLLLLLLLCHCFTAFAPPPAPHCQPHTSHTRPSTPQIWPLPFSPLLLLVQVLTVLFAGAATILVVCSFLGAGVTMLMQQCGASLSMISSGSPPTVQVLGDIAGILITCNICLLVMPTVTMSAKQQCMVDCAESCADGMVGVAAAVADKAMTHIAAHPGSMPLPFLLP